MNNRLKKVACWGVVAGVFLGAVGCGGGETRLVSSEAPVVEVGDEPAWEFFWLKVPEARGEAGSRGVRVPVYRFASRAAEPEPDPVVIMLGGPGVSTSSIAPYMRYYRYLEHRDVILVDQRGTSFAEPALECPEWDAALAAGGGEEVLAEAARACGDRLRREGVDLSRYQALEIARDMRDLRRLMGVERWNVVATSYGTKVAQVLMRIDGDAIRSVVLDSPMPLDRRYDEEHNANVVAVLERLLADCEGDAGCDEAFPALGDRLIRFLENCTSEERAVVFETLALGEPGPDPDLWARVWALLQSGVDVPNESDSGGNGPSPFAMGLRLAAWSAEEAGHADEGAVARERSAYPVLGDSSPALFSVKVIEEFGVGAGDVLMTEAVRSEIPALILVGTYDPLTPAGWSAHLARTLGSARVVEFAGWGHGPLYYWDDPIGLGLADAFVRDPGASLPAALVQRAGGLEISLP